MAARSLPAKKPAAGLPTPPNSLSPSLPPQVYKTRVSGSLTPPAATHVDSDIDLEDAVEHAKAQDSPQRGLTAEGLSQLDDLDAVGNITPGLLAKHHLPGILLENGPLAIRHVMGFLTTSVPGFAGIPPAKARRLVVGALEGRGSDGSQGGIDGDVIFEKVGWGRWDARKRGQASREARDPEHHAAYPQNTLRIPGSSTRQYRTRDLAASHDSDRDYDTPMEDVNTPEHEVDQMSFDGIDLPRASHKPTIQRKASNHDLDDITDEEDWASIGAAALRQGSIPLSGGLMPTNQRYAPHRDPRSRKRITRRTSSNMAKSMPTHKSLMYNRNQQQQDAAHALLGFSPLPGNGFSGDAQDREAVEALLKLSSV